jgi:hypothetical protein
MRVTKQVYQDWLDDLGVPEDDKWSNGGRIPDRVTRYGVWLRRNDPVAFEIGFQEFEREEAFRHAN